jgi:hypothetical protein
VAHSEQVQSSEGSRSRISLEGDQSSPWDSKKESILRRTQGRRCPSSQLLRKAISTLSDPAPSSGRYMTEIAQSNRTGNPGEYVTLWLKHVAL